MVNSMKFAGAAAAAIALMPALALVQTHAHPDRDKPIGATHRMDAQPERMALVEPLSQAAEGTACEGMGCLPVDIFRIGY